MTVTTATATEEIMDLQAEQKKLHGQTTRLVKKVAAIAIVDDESYEVAAGELKKLGALKKRVDEVVGPVKRKTYEAYKEAQKLLKSFVDPIEKAEKSLKLPMGQYAAQKKAEAEAERRRLEEEARKEAEAQREAEAKQLEEQGQAEAAAAKRVEPAVAPRINAPAAPAVDGVHTREDWKAEVVDIVALCRAIGNGQQDVDLVQPNMTAINRIVKALKANTNIPGVVARREQVVVNRG